MIKEFIAIYSNNTVVAVFCPGMKKECICLIKKLY